MADSIPSLRRVVNELQARIRELESRAPEIVERIVTKEVQVLGPERIVLQQVTGPQSERVVYVDNPDHIEMIRKLQAKCQSISQ